MFSPLFDEGALFEGIKMNKKNLLSIEEQRRLVETKLRSVVNESAESSFDVFTVIDAFLETSIQLAYRMSSHHQTVEDLIADKIINAKIRHDDDRNDIGSLH